MTTEKIPATVAILTRNSENTLERALESVRHFQEIIVSDGGSTDATLDIARRFGARILQQDAAYLGADGRLYDYGGARNQTLDAATHDWFFFLDSDEYVNAELVAAVRKIVTQNEPAVYWVDRKYVRGGAVIDYATTYPNRQMRFFSKHLVTHFIKKVHERIECKTGVVPSELKGTLFVPFDMSIEALRRKWIYQVDVEVQRVGPLSLGTYFLAVISYVKVSVLYILRYLRICVFAHGTRMPFVFEMERHIQHLRLARALWRNVRIV